MNDVTEIDFACGCRAVCLNECWSLTHCQYHSASSRSHTGHVAAVSRTTEQRTGHSREYWRYWFAGQALAGWVANPERPDGVYVYADDSAIAKRYADATLAALEADE